MPSDVPAHSVTAKRNAFPKAHQSQTEKTMMSSVMLPSHCHKERSPKGASEPGGESRDVVRHVVLRQGKTAPLRFETAVLMPE